MSAVTLPALERRPTHKALPLLRSELNRLTHRRLFRVLVGLLLLGIVVISTIVFFVHHQESATVGPRRLLHGADHRYHAYGDLPVALIATAIAVAALAFILGASSGGAEWSSRSMTLQLLFEPRRLRLLTIKWLALVLTTIVVGAAAMALSVAFGVVTASARGTWDSKYAFAQIMENDFAQQMWLTGLRALVVIALAATLGYAIAMLVRNTGASLGVAFVYFVVVENATRLALMKYGTEPFMLSATSVTALFPGGLDVPGRAHGEFGELSTVHVSNLRALTTMFVYCLALAIPAGWSFTRRDVS
jgi:multisubunit Na+/H+ antiporter MnhC subunit